MGRSGGSRGGGGGGRSSGGGGGRSFGGRSGGGGFNRGGGSSGRSGGSSRGGGMGGGLWGPSNRGHRPHRSGSGLGPFIFGYGLGRGSGGSNYGGGGGRGSGSALGTVLGIVIVIVVLVAVFGSCGGNSGGSGNITASTMEREALPAGSVNETDYYTDELDWIGNSTTLTAGMKNFYKATGVQPYLYITDTVDGSHNPTDAQVEAYLNSTYDSLFTDEAHMLLMFFEYDETYHTWYLAGSQAKTVLDNEAMDIMLDYIDRYYYDQSLTDEQMFSKAFDEAGKRIMEVTTSPWIPVLLMVVALAIVLLLFVWWRSHKKQKNLEAEQTQTILETPLETFGDTEAEERAKKYEGD